MLRRVFHQRLSCRVPIWACVMMLGASAAHAQTQEEKNEQTIYSQAHSELKEQFTSAKEQFESFNGRITQFKDAMKTWRTAVTRRAQEEGISNINELLDGANEDALKTALGKIFGENAVNTLEDFEKQFNIQLSDHVNLLDTVGFDPRKKWDWMYDLSRFDRELKKKGVYDKLDWIQDKFNTADQYIGRVGQLTEFMEVFDPTKVDQTKPGGRLRAVGGALKYASSLAENVPGLGHLVGFYIEATEVFADALDRLDGKIKAARQGALWGQFRDHEGIQKAFAGLSPDPDFDAKMFFEITDERPALKAADGALSPRVWEHLEDKRIFLFMDSDRFALLSGYAFGALYDGFAALRYSSHEPNRKLTGLSEFVAIVQSAASSGADPSEYLKEYDALYQKLCGPNSLQMRRVLAHAGEISHAFRGMLTGKDRSGTVEFSVLSTRIGEFRGLCLFSTAFRAEMRRLVATYQDRMVVTLVLLSADPKKELRNVSVQIDGAPVDMKASGADFEMLLPRRSHFDVRVDADGFLPVVGKYSFGVGGTVRVVLQTVTQGTDSTPGSTTSTEPPPADPSGTNPPPTTPEPPPIPPGSVRLAIRGASEVVSGTDVSLEAIVDGADLSRRRLAIIWYSGGQTEIARGRTCAVKAPNTGAVDIVAKVEEATATGKPRIHATASHRIKVAKIEPVVVGIRCDKNVVAVGSVVSLESNLTAPGIPWSRLRLEWSDGLGSETSAEFRAAKPGSVEIRLGVFRKLDAGEVKVGEAVHKLLVVSADLTIPKPVVQGKVFDVGIQPPPQIASDVKRYNWVGGSQFDSKTKRWDVFQAESGPRATMLYPIRSFRAEESGNPDVQISVRLMDANQKKLYEAKSSSPFTPVSLNGSAADIWEGGGAEREFGLTRKPSKSAPRTIDGNAVSTASTWGAFRMSLTSVSDETATPSALSSYVRKQAAETKNQKITAVSIPPFRGFLMKDGEVRYKGGGWSFDAGYRDASSTRTAQAWLTNGPALLKVSFHAGGAGRFDNSDEAWLKAHTESVFGEAETILSGLSFTPDGAFRYTPYDGPALDGSQDVAPLQVTLDGPAKDVSPGQEATVTANASGGNAPYSFAWEGDHAGKGASVRVPTLRPGEYTVAVKVTSQDGQSESATLTYRVMGAVGRLTGLPRQVKFGKEYTLNIALPGGLSGSRIYWHASPNVRLSQAETSVRSSARTSTSSTRILFDRCPQDGVKLWAQIINEQGATIGEAEQITVDVEQPRWRVGVTPPSPHIGERMEINVTPSWTLSEDLFDFYWQSPASDAREELNDSANKIAVVSRDSSPVSLQAEIRVPQTGDVLGMIHETLAITPQSYTVVASVVDAGPRPQVWKTGEGLVDVPRGTQVVDQRVLLQAQIPDYPNPSAVRWKWAANAGTSLTNPNAQYPTATRHEPGTATLTVVATDADNIELGKAKVEFQVIPQSVDVLPGSDSDDAGAAGTTASGSDQDTSSTPAEQLAATAIAQAERGDFEAAATSVRKVRELDAGIGFATADSVIARIKPQAEQAEQDWDFERSGQLYQYWYQIRPDIESARGVARAPAWQKSKREVETWRQDAHNALDRRDWERAEERLKSVRLWEDIMPGTPRAETEELAQRYEQEWAAYDAEFEEFRSAVIADRQVGRVDDARGKLQARLQQGGLARSDRNWIIANLQITEQLKVNPPKVTPLQKPWAHVAQIDTLWSLDADGMSGELGLTYYPDRLEGWLDFGAGREPLLNLSYSEQTSRISFLVTAAGLRFGGLVNGSRMQGPVQQAGPADSQNATSKQGTWVARLKSTTVRGESGQPADPTTLADAWTHQPGAIIVEPTDVVGGTKSGPEIVATETGTGMRPSAGSGSRDADPASGTAEPGAPVSEPADGTRILVTTDTTIEQPQAAPTPPGGIPLKAGAILTNVSGGWKAQEARESAKVYGPFLVNSAGSLKLQIDTAPHAPRKWSLGNADTGLIVQYQQKRGADWGPATTIAGATGLIIDNKDQPLTGEGSWPGPGRLTVLCTSPGGSGPLSGSQFEQTFKGSVEIVDVQNLSQATAGQSLKSGDRVRTGAQGGVLLAGSGSRYLAAANTDLTIESLDAEGRVKDLELRAGSLRVSETPQSPQQVRVNVRLSDEQNFRIVPTGTDYEVVHSKNTARVMVFAGQVEVSGPNGKVITVGQGQSLSLPAIELAPFDTEKDEGLGIGGLPAAELPFNDRVPEPAQVSILTVSDGRPDDNWVWQDPGRDCTMQADATGAIRVTVPDGNELWDYNGSAPRLLRKVTGDFDLTGELLLRSPGDHMAITEFVVYSPGSYIGEHARQFRDWLLVHYRLIGGGWARQENHNTLRLFRRPVSEGVPAPDRPVYVRMTRRSNVFRTYWSLNGNTWRLSSHTELNVGPTIWPGLVFKRVAHDGQRQDPAVTTVRNLTLKSGSELSADEWSLLLAKGSAELRQEEFQLQLQDDQQDQISVVSTRRLVGDLDVVVHYETTGWEHQPGQQRSIGLNISTLDDPDKNAAYIEVYQHDSSNGPVVRTDIKRDGMWRKYQNVSLAGAPARGWLRVERRDNRVTTYYWSEGEWNAFESENLEFPEAVWVSLYAGNNGQARFAAPLQATLRIERLLSGEQATNADEWRPPEAAILAEIETPKLELPPGVEAKQWRSPFSLGRIFFDDLDNAYVFSSAKDKSKLIQITANGAASTVYRGEPFAGLNYKSGVFDGEDLLVSVDYWPEGGNRHSGLLRVKPDGSFQPVQLPPGFGDAGDLIPAPTGGWYLSDFGQNNIFMLQRKSGGSSDEPDAMTATALIRTGERPEGMRELVQDPHTRELLVLNRSGAWPYGGPSAVYSVSKGSITPWVTAREGVTYESIDATTRSVLNDGVFILDSTGVLTRTSWQGTSEVSIRGLDGYTQFRFSPGGSVYFVGGENQNLLLRLWSPDGSALSSESGNPRPVDSSTTMKPGKPEGDAGTVPFPDTVPVMIPPAKPGTPTGRVLDSRSRLIGIWSVSAGTPQAVQMGIESPTGAVITKVQPGSAASRAGLRRGDLVVGFGDMEVENYEDLEAATLTSAVGSRQPVTIVRGLNRLGLEMTIRAGNAQTPPVATFNHPGGAYRILVPRSWKVAPANQREPSNNRLFRGLQSRDGNYLLYVYADATPAPDSTVALNQFVQVTMPQYPGRQVGRLTLGGYPAAFVGASGGTEQKRLVIYRLAVVVNGQRYDIDAIAPPLSDPSSLTQTLTAVLNTIRPVGNSQ